MERTFVVGNNNTMQGMADLWQEGQLCDVELVTEGTSISAHRIILAATVPYFRSMFLGEFKESKQSKVHLEGIESEALLRIINCVYNNMLTLDGNIVCDVLNAAHLFQMNNIVEICEKYMVKKLSNETCFTYLKIFEKFNLEAGLQAVNGYTLRNFVALSKTQDFLAIEKDALCSYLENEDLSIPEEIEAFRAVQAWIEHDRERSQYSEELIQHIRLAFIPWETLIGEVRNVEFMLKDNTCMSLLFEALNYKSRG